MAWVNALSGEYSRLQVRHAIEPCDPKNFQQIRIDVLDGQPSPDLAKSLLEVYQSAEGGTFDVLDFTEVNDDLPARPH
jgi:hypothetical protein